MELSFALGQEGRKKNSEREVVFANFKNSFTEFSNFLERHPADYANALATVVEESMKLMKTIKQESEADNDTNNREEHGSHLDKRMVPQNLSTEKNIVSSEYGFGDSAENQIKKNEEGKCHIEGLESTMQRNQPSKHKPDEDDMNKIFYAEKDRKMKELVHALTDVKTVIESSLEEKQQLQIELHKTKIELKEARMLIKANSKPELLEVNEIDATGLAEKAWKKGLKTWMKASNYILREIFSDEHLATHCVKGNRAENEKTSASSSEFPSLDNARRGLHHEAVQQFCMKFPNMQPPTEAEINVQMSSKMHTIRTKLKKKSDTATPSTASNSG